MNKKKPLLRALLLCAAVLVSATKNETNAQVKLTSTNKFQIGYNAYTPTYYGSYVSGSTNNGRASIEYYDNANGTGNGGLNFWIPWPAPNSLSSALFIGDKTNYAGFVGINNSNPQYRLDVNGPARIAGQVYNGSDVRLKQNIKPLQPALVKIGQLKGMSYQKKMNYPKMFMDSVTDEVKLNTIKQELERRKAEEQNLALEFGYLAQDMQKIYPELVSADEDGMLSINYIGLIPVAIEAIKEQQAKIELLQTQLNSCCAITPVIGLGKTNTGLDDITKSDIAHLQQNEPNPFSQSTKIMFYIAVQPSKAMLAIYDMQGLEIKSYTVTEKGSQSITIQSNDLRPGMYLYSLIVDGKEIDTKRMILTK